MTVTAYLNFDGKCEEAFEFYRKAVGAEIVMLSRFKDSPDPQSPGMAPPGSGNKVMHATLKIGDSTIMASDCHCAGQEAFKGFSLALAVPDAAAASKVFAALSEGGQVFMPLGKTFWSPCFGVLADRFGLSWMINTMP